MVYIQENGEVFEVNKSFTNLKKEGLDNIVSKEVLNYKIKIFNLV